MPFISTANAVEMSAHPCAELVPVQKRSILDRYYLDAANGDLVSGLCEFDRSE